MKSVVTLVIPLLLFSCSVYNEDTQDTEESIVFTINPGLDIDENGYYHFTLDQTKWQTIHRVSGTTLYKEGTPAEFVKVYWESNLFWYLGDTLGYIIHEGLTDDLVYVSYDTTYITGFSGMEVPTSNQVSYSNSYGGVKNMIAPVRIMAGDTMMLSWEYFDEIGINEGEIGIVLE